MKQLHSYRDTDREPLVLIFDRDIPTRLGDFPDKQQRKFWANDAHTVVNYMCDHLPIGLINHIYAQMAMRLGSVMCEVYEPETKEDDE